MGSADHNGRTIKQPTTQPDDGYGLSDRFSGDVPGSSADIALSRHLSNASRHHETSAAQSACEHYSRANAALKKHCITTTKGEALEMAETSSTARQGEEKEARP